MKFHINLNEVLKPIFDLLNNDATLQGTAYLSGTGKVCSQRVPVSMQPPYLLITLQSAIPDTMQTYTGELRIFCYTALLSNGQIGNRGNLILNQCDKLLNCEQFTYTPADTGLPSVTILPLYSLGIVPSIFNSDGDDDLPRGVVRYKITFGYNGN